MIDFECMKTPAALLGNINNSDEQMMSVVCSGAVGSGVWPRVESPVHNLNSIHGLPAGLSGFWTTFRQVLPYQCFHNIFWEQAYVSMEHKSSRWGYICSNIQQYIVWVKIIDVKNRY